MLFHFRLRIKLRCCAPLKLKGVVPSNGFMDLFVMVIPPEKIVEIWHFLCFSPMITRSRPATDLHTLTLLRYKIIMITKNLCETLNLMPNISHMLTFSRNTKFMSKIHVFCCANWHLWITMMMGIIIQCYSIPHPRSIFGYCTCLYSSTKSSWIY